MAVTAPAAPPLPEVVAVRADRSGARRRQVRPGPPRVDRHFSDRVRGGVYDPTAEADGGDLAVIYDEGTGEIVGIRGIPFLVGAVAARPRWTRLAWALIAGEYCTEDLHAE